MAPLTFSIDGKLIQGQQGATLTLQPPAGDAVALALLGGLPFPAGNLLLGSMKFSASTGSTIPFQAPGKAAVAFKANFGAFFGAGVYLNPAALLKDLSPNPNIASGIALAKAPGMSFLMLRCGYDAGLTAKGSMALGAGASLNFGGSASGDATFAVIHQFPAGDPARSALAANAALGFSANGAFAMALCRETDANTIRLRLFKLAKNGWTFAFNATAGEQVTLPGVFQQDKNIGDLISAVFGVHIAQLVGDLTNPGLTSASGVAKFIVERGIKEMPGVGDVETLFAAGKAKLDQFLKDWSNLPHQAATMLASILSKDPEIASLTGFLRRMKAIDPTDQNGVRALLKTALASADYFQTPAGRWIESAVPTTSLAAITGSGDWSVVKQASDTALSILDGQMLQSLIEYAEKNLGLDLILHAIRKSEPASLDAWLQSKLAAFLGKDPTARLVLADLQRAQNALIALRQNAEKFYDLAKQAVQKRYAIAFTSSYQKTESGGALLDASFDLTAGPDSLSALRDAIDGNLQRILLQAIPGVTISAAALTHGINRQSHSDLTMPFVDLGAADVSEALATVSPIEDHGRVLVYNLNAHDEATSHSGFFHASAQSSSKFAFKASLPVAVQVGVRQFSEPSVSYGYTLAKASSNMGAVQLRTDLQPLADSYFPGVFGPGALADWVHAIAEQIHPATGILGETLFTLDVTLPPRCFAPWFATSADPGNPQYLAMSLAVQCFLRRVIPLYYFASPATYDAGVLADAILAYHVLPPATGFKIDGGGHMGAPNGSLYFGVDAENLTALIETPAYADALNVAMIRARDILFPLDRAMSDLYLPGGQNIGRITFHAMQELVAPRILSALLLFENNLIAAIAKSGVQMATFRCHAATNPAAALKELSGFGDTFASAFNNRLGSNLLAGEYLRGLGTALLVESGRALAGNAAPAGPPTGLPRLTVVDSAPAVSLQDLLAGNLAKAKILLRETLVSQ
jgi:hypothetical protein